ncbi:MAG: tripartite tricarboxylate transporter substrate binding protein [Pseudomonadota bacterium]
MTYLGKTFFTAATVSVTMGAALVSTAVAPVLAADYPSKPVEFIVPWPPGDAEDILTRLIAEELQAETGTPAAVINKPGGGGGPFPGAVVVKDAEPDGYTVGSFVIGVPIVGDLYGIEGISLETFEPIGIFLTYPFVYAAAADAPFSNLDELAAHAKENDVVLGHFGHGITPTNIAFAVAENKGFEFAGDSAFDALDCNTLASGDADLITTTIPQILPCVNDLKIVGTVTEERIPMLPDVQTIGEQIPELKLALWNGLFVPAGTPQEAKDVVAAAAQKALQSKAATDYGEQTGTLIYWQGADEAAERIKRDHATTKSILETLGEL